MTEPNLTERLIALIAPLIAPLGYEIVHLEALLGRQKTLRLFIDFAPSDFAPSDFAAGSAEAGGGKIVGIEDCVKVTRALDEPLDQIPEIEAVFHGAYELEVSSPGVDRPLRTAKDYERFAGKEVRIHVFRPLTGEEMGNSAYHLKNPKQKNFLGKLLGLRENRVLLAVPSGSADKKPAKKASKSDKDVKTNSVEEVAIPLPLISKANLEPQFNLD